MKIYCSAFKPVERGLINEFFTVIIHYNMLFFFILISILGAAFWSLLYSILLETI